MELESPDDRLEFAPSYAIALWRHAACFAVHRNLIIRPPRRRYDASKLGPKARVSPLETKPSKRRC
eukprot:1699601-Amphidinium_carterae.1